MSVSLMPGLVEGKLQTLAIMLPIFILVGVLGNPLVIIVYALKRDRSTASLFILTLAIVDLVTCLLVIPASLSMELKEWRLESAFACKLYYFASTAIVMFSHLITTSIAFDRYFCLCHPYRRIMTYSRAKHCIIRLALLSIVIGIMSIFTVNVVKDSDQVPDPGSNSTMLGRGNVSEDYQCVEIRYWKNPAKLQQITYEIIQKTSAILFIICILSVFVLYILIYRSVSTVFNKRKSLFHNASQITTTTVKAPTKSFFYCCRRCRTLYCVCCTRCRGVHSIEDVKTSPNEAEPKASNNESMKEESSDQYCAQINDSELDTGDDSNHHQLESTIRQTSLQVPMDREVSRVSFTADDHHHSVADANNDDHDFVPNCDGKKKSISFRHSRLDPITLQNVKTAAMLFVVALVYIVTMVPTFLMMMELISLNLPVFYTYYVNNAVNPIIYGFMNPNFRHDIWQLVRRLHERFRSSTC